MTAILAIGACAALAILNAVRGSGYQWLRFVIAAVSGAVSWLAGTEPINAAVLGACVFVFMIQPWGRWYSLGNAARDLNPSDAYERAIETVADGIAARLTPYATKQRQIGDLIAWWISGTLFSIPLIVLASPWWVLLMPATLAVYAAAWTLSLLYTIQNPIRWGEAGKGAVIGLLCVFLAGCATPRSDDAYWGGVARQVGERVR